MQTSEIYIKKTNPSTRFASYSWHLCHDSSKFLETLVKEERERAEKEKEKPHKIELATSDDYMANRKAGK